MEKRPQMISEDYSKRLSEDSVRTKLVIVEISSYSLEDDDIKGKEISPISFNLVIFPSNIGFIGKKEISSSALKS